MKLCKNNLVKIWMVRSVNCFQTTWALAPLFKANYKYISIISINDQAANGEILDLYLKRAQEKSAKAATRGVL